jgi:hypothetical protein
MGKSNTTKYNWLIACAIEQLIEILLSQAASQNEKIVKK